MIYGKITSPMDFVRRRPRSLIVPILLKPSDQALQGLGYETDWIGSIQYMAKRLEARHRWDMVFNIAEGIRGFGREAQVPDLLDAYDLPYTFPTRWSFF